MTEQPVRDQAPRPQAEPAPETQESLGLPDAVNSSDGSHGPVPTPETEPKPTRARTPRTRTPRSTAASAEGGVPAAPTRSRRKPVAKDQGSEAADTPAPEGSDQN